MNIKLNDMIKGSLFLALGLILPYIFHLTGMAGTIFLPMHIPVLLCGFILGSRYGLIIGALVPFLNSIITGNPPIYPIGISMIFELATYGFLAGFLYKRRCINIFISLIVSMILGRVVSGIANYILLFAADGRNFVLEVFLIAAIIKPIVGVVIQLILIPILVKGLERAEEMKTLNGQ